MKLPALTDLEGLIERAKESALNVGTELTEAHITPFVANSLSLSSGQMICGVMIVVDAEVPGAYGCVLTDG